MHSSVNLNMKNYLKFVLSLFGFWLLFFLLIRILFVGYQFLFGYKINFEFLIKSLCYGVYMDLSMTAYLIALPLFVYFINKWIPFQKILFIYHSILILILSGITAADITLYREWGFRLDKTAFLYLTAFQEAGSFISGFNIISCILLFFLFVWLGYFLLMKFKFNPTNSYYTYVLNILLFPALIIPMRGGFSIIPMNPGKVYFSNLPYANHIALNAPWNILYTALQVKKINTNIQFMSQKQADEIVDSLFQDKNENVLNILKGTRPKVLIFIMESFTAKLINKKYNEKEITPRLNEWIKKGIYFSKAYSTGDRTEIGLASILSGFPAQPQSSIVHFPKKTEKLPSLIRSLKQLDYNSTFYYGGDISFASMSSFIYNSGIDKIIDKSSFSPKTYNAKWGVHDHILFEKVYDDILKDSSQFLKICLSLSSHPPYDIPEDYYWNENQEEVLFLNTVHYTDKHLGIILDKLAALPIWNDLMILVVADHGCRFPGNDLYHVPEKFHIPIWFGGGAITMDSTITNVISQNDIAPSILHQFGVSNEAFDFSQNIFSLNHKQTAYYAFNNGFGWVDNGGVQVFSNDNKKIILSQDNPKTNMNIAKAYLQKIWNTFNAL